MIPNPAATGLASAGPVQFQQEGELMAGICMGCGGSGVKNGQTCKSCNGSGNG